MLIVIDLLLFTINITIKLQFSRPIIIKMHCIFEVVVVKKKLVKIFTNI